VVAAGLRRVPAGEGPVLAWPIACGGAVAERTRAVGFLDGVLQVEVADYGWQKELRNLAPQYLAVINRYQRDAVRRIEFVIADAARRKCDFSGAPTPLEKIG
jgi:predicted nucleic acid-binding Zn ribbon protein